MVYFKVEKTPEDPSKVALELAEAMQSEVLHAAEIRHYQGQIELERGKVQQLTALSFDVRKKRAEGYVPKGRMDPFATYDLKVLEEELQEAKDRGKKYGEIIKEQQMMLQKHKNNIPKIKKRLAEANRAAKKKLNGG